MNAPLAVAILQRKLDFVLMGSDVLAQLVRQAARYDELARRSDLHMQACLVERKEG